jgi:N-acetylglutamate synthase-like GNAT family acetyltransferase
MENPKSEIHIEQIRPEHTWKLRRDVLYPSMTKNEMEMDVDADGIHFGAFKDNKIVGVISLFQQGTVFQFRKFAVDADQQHSGIGTRILNYVINYAAENGATGIWCNARVDAIGFYTKFGFSPTGRPFSKNGIDYEIFEKAITPASDQQ